MVQHGLIGLAVILFFFAIYQLRRIYYEYRRIELEEDPTHQFEMYVAVNRRLILNCALLVGALFIIYFNIFFPSPPTEHVDDPVIPHIELLRGLPTPPSTTRAHTTRKRARRPQRRRRRQRHGSE